MHNAVMTQTTSEENTSVASTWRAVAERYGVTRDVVRRDWRAAGMPGLPCAWSAIDAWRQTLKKSPAEPQTGDLLERDATVTAARRGKIIAEQAIKEAQATVQQHRARQLATDLVSMVLVEQFMTGFLTETRTQLMRLPEEVAAAYPEEWRQTLRDDLKGRVDLILAAIHGHVLSVSEIREGQP